ncbi:ribosome silencing factor [Janthinobacterium sp. PSPC3-1]|uniref:ribosome silencing factor n=1 Tax=Janthinobacterium sp. PSPC3-1 TaxID=2804653 RepID=UPI003CEFB09E
MDIKKLQTLVVDALEDVKGQDIAVFDTVHLTSLFDRIAIVSGTSNRQTKALAASVRDKVKEAGGEIIGMEGEDTGEWVLVDLGDMIVHIMQAPIRAYYRLEEIWGDKPVKLGAAKRAPKKAGDEPKKVSGHLAASKANVEATPVIEKKAPAKKAAATTAAKKAPAKKAVASKAVGKTVKVAPTKTETAAVKALKALPEKKVRAPRAAKPAADAAPAKTVIKRIKKVEE